MWVLYFEKKRNVIRLAYKNEELKNKLANDYYAVMQQRYDTIIQQQSLLWDEAKLIYLYIYKSFVKLIPTLGKVRTFDIHLPTHFLRSFDVEKIAFISYDNFRNCII